MTSENYQSYDYTPKPSEKFKPSTNYLSNPDSLNVSNEFQFQDNLYNLKEILIERLSQIENKLPEPGLEHKIDIISDELKAQSEAIRAIEQSLNIECVNCKKFKAVAGDRFNISFIEETKSLEVDEKLDSDHKQIESLENEYDRVESIPEHQNYTLSRPSVENIPILDLEKSKDFEITVRDEPRNQIQLEALEKRILEIEKFNKDLIEDLNTKNNEIKELKGFLEELNRKTILNEKLTQFLFQEHSRKAMEKEDTCGLIEEKARITMENKILRGLLEEKSKIEMAREELRGQLEEERSKRIEIEKLNLDLAEELKTKKTKNDELRVDLKKESENSTELQKIIEELTIELERVSEENKNLNKFHSNKFQELSIVIKSNNSIRSSTESENLDPLAFSHIAKGIALNVGMEEDDKNAKIRGNHPQEEKKIENPPIISKCREKDTRPLGECVPCTNPNLLESQVFEFKEITRTKNSKFTKKSSDC